MTTATKTNYTAAEAIEILTQEIDVLVDRLDTGSTKIGEAREAGRDVSAAESKWVGLLRIYEAKCQQRRDLGYVYPAKLTCLTGGTSLPIGAIRCFIPPGHGRPNTKAP
jgi:hypothetical protein